MHGGRPEPRQHGVTLAVRLIPTWVLELHLFLLTCAASYNMVSAHQKGTEPFWVGAAQYTNPTQC